MKYLHLPNIHYFPVGEGFVELRIKFRGEMDSLCAIYHIQERAEIVAVDIREIHRMFRRVLGEKDQGL